MSQSPESIQNEPLIQGEELRIRMEMQWADYQKLIEKSYDTQKHSLYKCFNSTRLSKLSETFNIVCLFTLDIQYPPADRYIKHDILKKLIQDDFAKHGHKLDVVVRDHYKSENFDYEIEFTKKSV